MSKQNNSTQQSKELTQTNTNMSPPTTIVTTTTTQLANLDISQGMTAGIPNDVLPEDLIVTFDDNTLPDFDRMWHPDEPPSELELVDGGDDPNEYDYLNNYVAEPGDMSPLDAGDFDDDAPVGWFEGPAATTTVYNNYQLSASDIQQIETRVQQRLNMLNGGTGGTVMEYLAHAAANGTNHGDANPQ